MEQIIGTLAGKRVETKELALSCTGFGSVNWDSVDDEFEFVFSDDRVCRTHSVLAEFISPKVSRLRKVDPCGSFYIFRSDCAQLFEVFEVLVSSLRNGSAFRVDKSNISALLRISHELENREILSSLLQMTNTESLTLEEMLIVLRFGIKFGISSSGQFSALCDVVSSRFHELSNEVRYELDLETSELLLSNPSLQIESEDSLYDFVRSRSEGDKSFSSLFEFVLFEYLSEDRVRDFVSFANEHLLENLTSGIWSRVSVRLVQATKVAAKNPRVISKGSKKEFLYDSSKPLSGVIAYLTEQFHGNVHDKGIVQVTSNSECDSGYEPKNVADLGTNACFVSQIESNCWIRYDFKDRRVTPTSYSVRTHSGPRFPKSWALEASNNGKDWILLDRRDNNNDLNRKHVIRNFTISSAVSDGFQFIQFRQTGKNHHGDDQLYLTSLEVFGILSEP